ncbi:MAG: M20 family metallo-hydrolase [Caldilineaceae bacterium]|nr:M20 family metallo-hydrolase [Caldilineaceae bacterium]
MRKPSLETLVAQLDGEQLLSDLETLGQVGLRPEGGLARMAYGAADLEARQWVLAEMEALGMSATMDAAGNVIGVLAGDPALPALAAGSHTDSVPGGGKYDGALGVLAALACVRTLQAAGHRLRHPLLVVDFAGEEATTAASPTGSLSFVGQLQEHVLDQPAWTGQSTRRLLEEQGFEPTAMAANHPPMPIAAFLELHIEQGEQLDVADIPAGLVEGIVGIRRYLVTFQGQANHAGTTGMARRRDALVAAAPFVTAVRDVAMDHRIVGTVGRLAVHPGAPNVIPGRVEMDVEIRALDNAVLDRAERELAERARAAGATFFHGLRNEPVHADRRLMAALELACQQLNVRYTKMPSGAGHDAMNMAAICPFAMIFVPSVGGISHAPEEYTRPDHCVTGARLLLAALLELDSTLDA